jgi:hypothetical protein
MDGSLIEAVFDDSLTNIHQVQLIGHVPDCFHMSLNPFDKRILLALSKSAAFIYIVDSSVVKLTAKIDGHGGSCIGGKFFSMKTLMIWTSNGHASFYYLGDRKQIQKASLKEIPEEAMVLLSDGSHAFYSNDFKMDLASAYRYFF